METAVNEKNTAYCYGGNEGKLQPHYLNIAGTLGNYSAVKVTSTRNITDSDSDKPKKCFGVVFKCFQLFTPSLNRHQTISWKLLFTSSLQIWKLKATKSCSMNRRIISLHLGLFQ